MDGIHDLGGKQGYGPIDVNEPVEPFHAEWEARGWGITCSVQIPGARLDWWRHIRETSIPSEYITRPYLDNWLLADMVTMIESGLCTVDELASGRSATGSSEPPTSISVSDAVAANRASENRFDRPISDAPAYAIGDKVVALADGVPGHTRLPAYVRGRPGRVHAHHGAHLFADAGAKGVDVAQHLYTVAFDFGDLWPEAEESSDVVFLDLWESYLAAG